MSSVRSESVAVQYAALPWRNSGSAVEILLITTRRTRRWIIPKGWSVPGCTAAQCAASEALEEAGVTGEMSPKAIGSFLYDKQRKSGDAVRCEVFVFPMEVVRQRRSWPEKLLRETRWCSIDEALARIGEPGLHQIIAKFAKSHRRAKAVALSARQNPRATRALSR